jgi:RNA polymerase sigma-70 factor, ECF subfamily
MKKSISELSDEKIVGIVCGEDQEQYAELVKRYEEKLLRYVRYMIGDREADEVVQETFIKAFVKLRSFDEKRGKFSSWIYRISHNEAMNKIKKKKHVSLDFNDWLKEILPGKVNVEVEYERQEEKEMVRRCLNGTDLIYRSVLSLYYLEDKSYDEISEILKIPMGTVGIRLRRGKEKMKEICNNNI